MQKLKSYGPVGKSEYVYVVYVDTDKNEYAVWNETLRIEECRVEKLSEALKHVLKEQALVHIIEGDLEQAAELAEKEREELEIKFEEEARETLQ